MTPKRPTSRNPRLPAIIALAIGFLLTVATSLPLVDEANGQQAATCTKYPGNPVLVSGSQGSWDNTGVEYQFVMFNGSSFIMFYTGIHNNVTSGIGLATSTDGVRWTKYATPVLEAGKQGSWDSSYVYFPLVIWNGTEYLMYYTGINSTTSASIGLAFSKDMLHWQKYANNPVLKPGPGIYDNVSITSHSVMYDPPLYKMWYSGRYPGNYTHSIGYATSPDGVHWIKYSDNPVLTRGTTHYLYYFGPWGPSVVKLDSVYLAAFETDGLISYATSPDGVHWNSTGVPLLRGTNQTPVPEFTVEAPSLLLVNSTLYLWYSRFPNSYYQPVNIGFAFCGLSPLVLTTTITSTSPTTTRSTIIQTSISVTTVIQTSTTTEEVPTAALPLYQASTAILGILLLTLLAMVFARRRRK